MSRAPVFLALFLLSLPLAAQKWERILIPLFESSPLRGAHGSEWVTELVVRNTSDEKLTYWPTACAPFIPPRFCMTPGMLPPQSTSRPSDFAGHESGPLFLNVPEGYAASVAANLRIRDVSRVSDQFGTAIPVIREREVMTWTAHLLDVPSSTGFRAMLRIYDFDARPVSSFAVRVFDLNSDDLLHEETILTFGFAYPPDEPMDRPGYAQIALDSFGDRRLRIEVEPLDGARFWTFASVTANETQLVTIIEPL